MRHFIHSILLLFTTFSVGLAQAGTGNDSIPCDTCTTGVNIVFDDCGYSVTVEGEAETVSSSEFYKGRYGASTLLDKITDNKGEGYDCLYGTRNLRPIVHGAAYRGGANNYFHRENKRRNQNPLPPDGIQNLCEEGFSRSVYLYRTNAEDMAPVYECNCIDGDSSAMEYHQLDYFDSTHIRQMLVMVHESIVNEEVGPVYLHCWNGWHASGYLAALILRQFCGYSGMDAVNYWDLGTDGANVSPRYNKIRNDIKNFKPYPELMITDSLGNYICPEMPDNIDSSQLHIEVEHLAIVPEAVPVGYKIVLYNVSFRPYKTSLSNPGGNKDLQLLLQAMQNDPLLKVEIGGHTDKSGKAAENKALSSKRAQSVYNFLINSGISTDRVSYKGYGAYRPLYTNRTKAGRAGNRRIEVTVLAKTAHANNKLVDENVPDNTAEASINKSDTTPPTTDKKEEPVTTETHDVKEVKEVKATTAFPNVEPVKMPLLYDIESLAVIPEEIPVGTRMVLYNLKFAPYSSTITDQKNPDLQALLGALKLNPKLKVEIGGHTDPSGVAQQNLQISKDRAKAVFNFLTSHGVDANRLAYRGYGSSVALFTNKTPTGRAKNRRTEIMLVEK